MYKAYHIVVKKGQAEEIVNSTDNPWDWFPELKMMFDDHHFSAKELKFNLDLDKIEGLDKEVVRITFHILKVDEDNGIE